MEPQQITYGINRCYLEDLKVAQGEGFETLVSKDLWDAVSGYNRAQDYQRLAACSSLFCWHSHSVEDWRFLRQVEAFFKKNASFAVEEDCVEAARKSFFENEIHCANTNFRLREAMYNPDQYDRILWLRINLMRRFVKSVLGDFHEFISELPTLVRVTSGATAQSCRRNSLPQQKLKLALFCTKRAGKYVSCLYRWFGFDKFRIKNCESNRIELVPKDWRRHRTIACEPEGNLPLQLAFDTWVKRKLRPKGIDLRFQSRNIERAKHASIHDDFVTVDFSNASDSISIETVRWLMPHDWFHYLEDVRSPNYRGVFGEGKYAKFSSMGNGATFVLETLIFSAVCHALGSTKYLVYGDDVIIEKRFYPSFLELTQFLGFTVNEEKSFSEGPFRESCGGDFFNGQDVTPIYIRRIDSRKATLCHLINTMRVIAQPYGALAGYLNQIVKTEFLPEVPYNDNTMSGVWIDPHIARTMKLLVRRSVRKDGPILNYYRAFVPKVAHRQFLGIRGYYLWFLRKQVCYAQPWDSSMPTETATITSLAPVFLHKYVRKWVVWHEPDAGTPDHLLWSEPLTRPRGPVIGRGV